MFINTKSGDRPTGHHKFASPSAVFGLGYFFLEVAFFIIRYALTKLTIAKDNT